MAVCVKAIEEVVVAVVSARVIGVESYFGRAYAVRVFGRRGSAA